MSNDINNKYDENWTSEKFLKIAFQKPNEQDFKNIKFDQCSTRLSNFLSNYSVKESGGGKSGAKVLLLYKQNGNKKIYTHVLKYFDVDDSKTNNNKKYKFVRKNRKNETSTSAKKRSEINIKTDSDLSYIRGIREIYLGKKFDEIQKKENYNYKKNRISSEIEFIGFLKNKKIEIKDNKIEIKDKQNNIYIYIPFTIQTLAEGTELLKLKPKNTPVMYRKQENLRRILPGLTSRDFQYILDDVTMYNILYELAKVIYILHKIIENGGKFVGCHRDLHPGNIFVDIKDDGSVKISLIDFDLSITNTSNLTKPFNCSRETLSNKTIKLNKTIGTTFFYTQTGNKIKSSIKKKWEENELLNKDNDLYQYYQYWNYFYDYIQSNMIKKFLEDSMNSANEKIKKENKKKELFLYTLICELNPNTNIK